MHLHLQQGLVTSRLILATARGLSQQYAPLTEMKLTISYGFKKIFRLPLILISWLLKKQHKWKKSKKKEKERTKEDQNIRYDSMAGTPVQFKAPAQEVHEDKNQRTKTYQLEKKR